MDNKDNNPQEETVQSDAVQQPVENNQAAQYAPVSQLKADEQSQPTANAAPAATGSYDAPMSFAASEPTQQDATLDGAQAPVTPDMTTPQNTLSELDTQSPLASTEPATSMQSQPATEPLQEAPGHLASDPAVDAAIGAHLATEGEGQQVVAPQFGESTSMVAPESPLIAPAAERPTQPPVTSMPPQSSPQQPFQDITARPAPSQQPAAPADPAPAPVSAQQPATVTTDTSLSNKTLPKAALIGAIVVGALVAVIAVIAVVLAIGG